MQRVSAIGIGQLLEGPALLFHAAVVGQQPWLYSPCGTKTSLGTRDDRSNKSGCAFTLANMLAHQLRHFLATEVTATGSGHSTDTSHPTANPITQPNKTWKTRSIPA